MKISAETELTLKRYRIFRKMQLFQNYIILEFEIILIFKPAMDCIFVEFTNALSCHAHQRQRVVSNAGVVRALLVVTRPRKQK